MSANMNERASRRGCILAKESTNSPILTEEERILLQRSRLIFIKASLCSDMVDLLLVLICFSWLKLLSLSHEVIGSVKAIWSKTCMFGN